MDFDLAAELRRPVTLTILGFAVLGWIVVVWSIVNANSDQAQSADLIASLRRQADQISNDLKAERVAAGSLSDIEERRVAAQSAIAAAQNAANEANKTKQEALAQLKSAQDSVQQLTAQQSGLEQTVAQTNADVEKARAELENTIRHNGVVTEQAAQADNELSAAKSEMATLAGDRDKVGKAVSDLSAERDRLSAEVDRDRTQIVTLDQQVAQAQAALDSVKASNQQAVAAATAQRDGLKQDADALTKQLSALRQDAAQAQKDLETARASAQQTVAAAVAQRDSLKQEADALTQRLADLTRTAAQAQATLQATRTSNQQLIAAGTAQRDSLKKEADALEQRLSGIRQTMAQVEATLAARQADQVAIAKTVQDATTARDRLTGEVTSKQKVLADLQDRVAALETAVKQRRSDLDETGHRLEEARSDLKAIQDQIAAAKAAAPASPGGEAAPDPAKP